MAIGKKLRFEVFKRDSFTCQYCGQKAPDVFLEADHIEPRSKGGKDSLMNLITACRGCNSGKSNRKLSDDTVLVKQRDQLKALQDRREQVAMMFEWQKSLSDIEDDVLHNLTEYWDGITVGYSLTDTGISQLRKLTRKFTIPEIMKAMKIAADEYLQRDEEDKLTKDSAINAFAKIGGICFNHKNPGSAALRYIRGIMRNRFSYCDDHRAMILMQQAVKRGMSIEALKLCALESKHWSEWRTRIGDV
jgi:hypothetical protein